MKAMLSMSLVVFVVVVVLSTPTMGFDCIRFAETSEFDNLQPVFQDVESRSCFAFQLRSTDCEYVQDGVTTPAACQSTKSQQCPHFRGYRYFVKFGSMTESKEFCVFRLEDLPSMESGQLPHDVPTLALLPIDKALTEEKIPSVEVSAKLNKDKSQLLLSFKKTYECYAGLMSIARSDVHVGTGKRKKIKKNINRGNDYAVVADFERLYPFYAHAIGEMYGDSSNFFTRSKTTLANFRLKIGAVMRDLFRATPRGLRLSSTENERREDKLAIDAKNFDEEAFVKNVKDFDVVGAFSNNNVDLISGTKSCRFPLFVLNNMQAGIDYKNGVAKRRAEVLKQVTTVVKMIGGIAAAATAVATMGASMFASAALNAISDLIESIVKTYNEITNYHRALRLAFITFFQGLMIDPAYTSSSFGSVKPYDDCTDTYKVIQHFYVKMFKPMTPEMLNTYVHCVQEAPKGKKKVTSYRTAKARAFLAMLKSFITVPTPTTDRPAFVPPFSMDVYNAFATWQRWEHTPSTSSTSSPTTNTNSDTNTQQNHQQHHQQNHHQGNNHQDNNHQGNNQQGNNQQGNNQQGNNQQGNNQQGNNQQGHNQQGHNQQGNNY